MALAAGPARVGQEGARTAETSASAVNSAELQGPRQLLRIRQGIFDFEPESGQTTEPSRGALPPQKKETLYVGRRCMWAAAVGRAMSLILVSRWETQSGPLCPTDIGCANGAPHVCLTY